MSRASPLPRSGDRSKTVMVGLIDKLRVFPGTYLGRLRYIMTRCRTEPMAQEFYKYVVLKLYHCAETRSMRSLWLLNELRIPFELLEMPFDLSVMRSPDYLA